MSWLSSLFKPKAGKTITQEAMQTDEQKNAMKMLSDFASTGNFGDYNAGDAYGGSLGDYEMTDATKLGQSQLMDMLKSAMPEAFTMGQQEFKDVLATDKYDPYAKGSLYEGFKRNTMRESQDAKDALQRDLALTGDMYSSDRAKQLGILGERTSNSLQDKLAELYDQYSQRRLSAAQQLGQMGQQEESMNSNRINLASTIGDMQRQLNDQKAKAKYADWIRAREEQQSQIDAAKTLFQKDVPYGLKSITGPDKPSTFMSMLGELNPIVGSYNTQKYGYSTNQNSLANEKDNIMKFFTGGGGTGSSSSTSSSSGTASSGNGAGIAQILKLLLTAGI